MTIVINNLAKEVLRDTLMFSFAKDAIENGAITGKTTAHCLSFVVKLLNNPDQWHKFEEEADRPDDRPSTDFKRVKDYVEKLGLRFIEFSFAEKSARYKLHSKYANEYALAKGIEIQDQQEEA